MAKTAAKVTMLQRSPTYVISRPSIDARANWLRRWLPADWAYALTRWHNTLFQQIMYRMTRVAPDFMRKRLLRAVREEIGDVVDVDRHFTPSYNPWDQRLCLVPDGDLYAALRSGKAEVVTDHIERITESGITLKSGEELEADIIVCATGLELVILGGATFTVDGEAVDFANEWTYKGLMCSNVPNMVQTFGYINASWTLRADLTAEWVCRVLNHMSDNGFDTATPRCPEPLAAAMPKRLWIDDFSAGYMQRVLPRFPKQGDRPPWINPQDYRRDRKLFRDDPLEDGALIFSREARPAPLREAS
jgi:cation diffusion facilitator CzcD-associated flavoprotein CzcO